MQKYKIDEEFVDKLELDSCPFCGSTKIRLSSKTTQINRKTGSHVCFYCWDCNTYEPRVVVHSRDYHLNYPYMVSKDVIEEAANRWNKRIKNN